MAKKKRLNIITGARKHDFRLFEEDIFIENLPSAFDGLTIGQVSDFHAGSFHNEIAVRGGLSLLTSHKPDIIFFTGDLVNQRTDEAKEYFKALTQLKANLGVYSILGNHDYGDYFKWKSQAAKVKNLEDMVALHKALGWHLLLNEHDVITIENQKMAIIGVENWGRGKFMKYGDAERAMAGSDECVVKLLLSHDPTHWDDVVLKHHPEIDVMFAGHTHGFQVGIESKWLRWSPSQYKYKRWAGLYKEGHQYLYVNRGYGYLTFSTRIGIFPEVSLLTLRRLKK